MRKALTGVAVLALVAIVVCLYMIFSPGNTPEEETSIVVNEEPLQTALKDATPWKKGAYMIYPLAQYTIRARVLSIEYYRFGREANLSPVDFALGWGPMSDLHVLKDFEVNQHERWCTWRSSHSPIPIGTVLRHSANVHLVPSSKALLPRIGQVQSGDIVRITGKLIEAQGSDGWTWTSSLSREDEGEQSCEIIWVESIEIERAPSDT